MNPTPPKKDGRGGRREGAGRKLIAPGQHQKIRNITLDDAMNEKAKRIGGGNVSKGIRLALEAYPEG